jgi:hypothetical protein
MTTFKYLQPLDQMERISRTELGEQLDEILEKVDKNNVGIVITDEGKRDLVLCPAHWFAYMFDDDFGCIVNSALRYSIGRHTYMPSVMMSFVRKYLDVIDTRTISVMIEDIEREASDEKLDYREDWLKLRNDLKEQYEKLLQAGSANNVLEKEKNE